MTAVSQYIPVVTLQMKSPSLQYYKLIFLDIKIDTQMDKKDLYVGK